ncbi:MAG: tetratricopeptide repeat protein [Candidatus Saccharimonadales bacterium]
MGKAKNKKKKIILIVSIALLLIAAAAAGLTTQWFLNKNGGQPSDDPSKDQAALERSKLPATIEEVQALRVEGKDDEANKKADSALSNPSISNDDRYMLYIQKGAAYENQGNLQEAYNAYLKASETKQTLEVFNLLGDVAAQLGKKQEAIDFYKKAIPLIDQNNPRRDAEKRLLEQKIRDLGGQP